MAFALREQARLFWSTYIGGSALTTLQASLDVTDWSFAPPRFEPGLSTTHRDLGVSRDRTSTGWPSSTCRLVTS
jgi:hypothetical protein